MLLGVVIVVPPMSGVVVVVVVEGPVPTLIFQVAVISLEVALMVAVPSARPKTRTEESLILSTEATPVSELENSVCRLLIPLDVI